MRDFDTALNQHCVPVTNIKVLFDTFSFKKKYEYPKKYGYPCAVQEERRAPERM